MRTDPVKVFVLAGEPSGDQLGAAVMKRLSERLRGEVLFSGVGGPAMEAEGLQSLFPMRDLTVMGLVEVLCHLPRLTRRLRQTVDAALTFEPDIFLSIDSPSFTLRIAARLRKRCNEASFPLIHLVAPSVWAWKAWRAKTMAGYLDHLLTLLPFEPPYFERHGLPATFVGHPATWVCGDALSVAEAMHILGRSQEKTGAILCLLPGSRRMEVSRLLPLFKDTLDLVTREVPGLQILLPTVPGVAAKVREEVKNWPWAVTVLESSREKRAAFTISDLALAASGTVAVELAAANVPAIITYKVNPVSAALARRMLKIRYVSLINLMLDREVQPEFLQERAQPDILADAVLRYLAEPDIAAAQLAGLAPALARMRGPSGDPAEHASEVMLHLLAEAQAGKKAAP